MSFSKEQLLDAIKKNRLSGNACANCGKSRHIVSPFLVYLSRMAGDTPILGGDVTSLVMVTCSTCAKVELFNSAQLSILIGLAERSSFIET